MVNTSSVAVVTIIDMTLAPYSVHRIIRRFICKCEREATGGHGQIGWGILSLDNSTLKRMGPCP